MNSRLKVCLLGLLLPVGMWAQASNGFGAVSGIVTQAGAEGMPEANVVLSNPALGTQFTIVTSDDGVFNAPALVPAAGYRLKVTRDGYQSWESEQFAVSAGQTVEFKIPLQAVDTAGKGGSSGAGPSQPLNMSKTGTSEQVIPREVNLLPTSARRLDELIPLAPAVTTEESNPGVMVTRGLPFSNALFLDGIYSTDTFFLQQKGLARQVSQDAVQDFQVLASNEPAEYGRAMGGIVDAASRSGTTGYHGSAYEYFRSPGLSAYDAYAAGYDTRQTQHQFGADLGGPIYGDRLFFFANFEGLDRSGDGINRVTNPLIADPTGRTVLASNCTATAAQCTAATKFIQSQMNVLEPLWEHSVTGLAKIDYRRSERNAFSFEANAMHYHAPSLAQTGGVAPNGGLVGDPTLVEENRYAKVGWVGSISPDTVNDLRVGLYRDRIDENPNLAGLSTGALGINIAGTIVGQQQPYAAILPSEHRLQIVDNLHRTYNSHLFQVGLDFSRTRDLINDSPNAAGAYTYPSLTAFAQDFTAATSKNYTSFTQTFGSPLSVLHMKELNVYAQGTWKATQRLTITYGLRYERPFLPQPPANAVNSTYYQTASIAAPWLNLAPRFAVAYMLDQKTAFRAGYGWYYTPFPGQFLNTLFLGNGIYQPSISVNPNQLKSPAFPNIIPNIANIPNGTREAAFAGSKLRNPYTADVNVAIERSVTNTSTLTVGYIRTRGYKLWTSSDVNLAPTSTTEQYTVDNAAHQAVSTFTTPFYTAMANGAYSHVYQIDNNGSYWYDALAVQWKWNLSHGLSFLGSYTWSHAIDDLGPGSATGFSLIPSTTGDVNADRGNSALDQRHRAVIRWTWAPALRTGGSAAVRGLLNGWAFSGIATLASPQYVTPQVFVQGQQFSSITMVYTGTLSGSGSWNRVPFDPVNSLSLGSQYTVNGRLARTLSFGERIKATVAFEAFSILNRQFATAVNTIAYLSVSPIASGLINGPHFGTLMPVPGLGTGIASQGYPDGTNARRAQLAFRIAF